jgi:hypothetical protein
MDAVGADEHLGGRRPAVLEPCGDRVAVLSDVDEAGPVVHGHAGAFGLVA